MGDLGLAFASMSPLHRRVSTAVAGVLASLAAVGCGGAGDDERSELANSLEGLGRGVSAAGSGFGWADLSAVRRPADLEWAANALGPGADDLLDDRNAIARGTGFSTDEASAAVSIAGSYTLGARFDGTTGGRLPRLLLAAGARSRRAGEWMLFNLGGWAEGQTKGPLAPLGALASRVAVGPDAVVLARYGPARRSLIAQEGSVLDTADAELKAGIDCLGDVDAARLIPGNFTHQPGSSPEMIAIGIGAAESGHRPETLCAVFESVDEADEAASELRAAFAPDATDEVTRRPIAESVEEVEVERTDLEGTAVAKAVLRPATGVRPGLLFGAFVRGSLLTYLGADRPFERSP